MDDEVATKINNQSDFDIYPQSLVCHGCRTEVESNWDFCPKCGMKIDKGHTNRLISSVDSQTNANREDRLKGKRERQRKAAKRRRQRASYFCCYDCETYYYDNNEVKYCSECELDITKYGMSGIPVCHNCGDADDVKEIQFDTLDTYFCHYHGYTTERERCNGLGNCNPVDNRYAGLEYWCKHCDVGIDYGCRTPCRCPDSREEKRKKRKSTRKVNFD